MRPYAQGRRVTPGGCRLTRNRGEVVLLEGYQRSATISRPPFHGHVEIFDHDDAALAGQTGGELVQAVTAQVRDLRAGLQGISVVGKPTIHIATIGHSGVVFGRQMSLDHPVPEKQSRFLTFFTTLPGVITAVAALITAVGGLLVAIEPFGNHAPPSQAAGTGQPRPSAAVTSAGVGVSPTAAAPELSTAPPVAQAVDYSGARIKKTMTVKLNDVAYLSDGSTGAAYANGDFKLDSADLLEYLRMYGGRPIFDEFAPITDTVSKESCAAALRHPAGDFQAKPTDEGSWLCVIRPDASYGAIHLDKVDLVDHRLTITYLVWR
jgi:hypothetical protein